MSLIMVCLKWQRKKFQSKLHFKRYNICGWMTQNIKKADTLSKILVAAKDKPKEDEIVYIEALESIIGENGSYKDLGDAKIVDKSWDTEGTQFNIKGFQACASSLMENQCVLSRYS